MNLEKVLRVVKSGHAIVLPERDVKSSKPINTIQSVETSLVEEDETSCPSGGRHVFWTHVPIAVEEPPRNGLALDPLQLLHQSWQVILDCSVYKYEFPVCVRNEGVFGLQREEYSSTTQKWLEVSPDESRN